MAATSNIKIIAIIACREYISRAVTTAVFTVLHTCGCMQRLLWYVLVITTAWLVSVCSV